MSINIRFNDYKLLILLLYKSDVLGGYAFCTCVCGVETEKKDVTFTKKHGSQRGLTRLENERCQKTIKSNEHSGPARNHQARQNQRQFCRLTCKFFFF